MPGESRASLVTKGKKVLGRTQDGAVRTTQDWSSHCVCREVSLSCISRLILVAHGMGKFPSEEESRDARQIFRLAKPAAGVAAAGPTQRSSRAHLSGGPVEPATGDVRGLDLRLS